MALNTYHVLLRRYILLASQADSLWGRWFEMQRGHGAAMSTGNGNGNGSGNGGALTVVTIGTDMVYNETCGHFYCGVPHQKVCWLPLPSPHLISSLFSLSRLLHTQGAMDPLKFGEEWLDVQLQHVKDRYESRRCKILNASTLPTRLPFEPFRKYIAAEDRVGAAGGNSTAGGGGGGQET